MSAARDPNGGFVDGIAGSTDGFSFPLHLHPLHSWNSYIRVFRSVFQYVVVSVVPNSSQLFSTQKFEH